MTVAQRFREIRDRIALSARAANRDPKEVTLIAVCKRQPVSRVLEAHDCGVMDFAENTAQGLQGTAKAMSEASRDARWHFIGHLQRNKVNGVLRHADTIHSVDSRTLAEALSKRASERGIDIYVQVNVGDEPQKGGVAPGEAVDFARWASTLPRLRVRGLMTVPPAHEASRPHFMQLAELSDELQRTPEGREASGLSMGMSSDFETAIACGATVVRVGTLLFGPRTSSKTAIEDGVNQ